MIDGRWYWKTVDTMLGMEKEKIKRGEHAGKIVMHVHEQGNPGERRVFLASEMDNNRVEQVSLQPLGAVYRYGPQYLLMCVPFHAAEGRDNANRVSHLHRDRPCSPQWQGAANIAGCPLCNLLVSD